MKLNKIKIVSISLITLLTFAGCGNEPTPKPILSCPLPSGYNLDEAIEEGKKTVMLCPNKYDTVMNVLFDIAKTDKSPDNRRKLAIIPKEAVDNYKLPKEDTIDSYRKYSSSDFISIPDRKRSITSECVNYDKLKDEMQNELEMKRRFFLEVTGEEDKFGQIYTKYENYMNALEVLCSK